MVRETSPYRDVFNILKFDTMTEHINEDIIILNTVLLCLFTRLAIVETLPPLNNSLSKVIEITLTLKSALVVCTLSVQA